MKNERILKFRAWDADDKKMLMHDDVHFVIFPNGEIHAGGSYCEGGTDEWVWGCNWENECDYLVMQFIGQKDKKGNEIYEGDIVKVRSAFDEEYKIAVIVYEQKDIGFNAITGEHSSLVLMSWGDLEILGNIYENPDLLTPELTLTLRNFPSVNSEG